MDGYQDTLYTHTKRQFYRDCTISGTIDFIFGDAAVIFQNCTFVVRKPLDNQQCIVTAQGRKERRQPSAIIIQNSTFTADPEYYPYRNELKSYLGRPWKEFSRTIIMESYIEDLIQPSGWLPWAGDFALRTCFYTEFRNRGPGAKTHDRVKWRGIKTIKPSHAIDFAPGRFLSGDRWIPSTGVPYNSGLFTLLSNVTTKSQGRIWWELVTFSFSSSFCVCERLLSLKINSPSSIIKRHIERNYKDHILNRKHWNVIIFLLRSM